MGRPIEITRFEHSVGGEPRELRKRKHPRTRDGAVVRRLLAIAQILEGYPREAAAQAQRHGSAERCATWVLQLQCGGRGRIAVASQPGAPLAALNEAQMEELRSMVLERPGP